MVVLFSDLSGSFDGGKNIYRSNVVHGTNDFTMTKLQHLKYNIVYLKETKESKISF